MVGTLPPSFSHKKGGVGKIGGVLKKRGTTFNILTKPFKCDVSVGVWCACVGFVYLYHFY